MKTHALDVLATPQNFNEADYLAANPDVAAAVAARQLPDGLTHFTRFGAAERRMLRDAGPIAALRRAKMTHMRPLLRTDIARREHDGKYDYLSEALRSQTRVEATSAVSANPYDAYAEALIAECADGIVADCGAGRRPVYYSNVVNVEIVDYDTTDLIAVGEALPFRTGTIDAVISVAVLEHVRDPFRCAAEIARVLRPGGKLLCAVPFLQPEHGYPHHYYNMTRQGLRALFEDTLHIDDHRVVPSTFPVWTLTWFLKSWASGLSGAALEQFRTLRMGDLADASPSHLLQQAWVRELTDAKNFELASATVLFAHKPVSSSDRPD